MMASLDYTITLEIRPRWWVRPAVHFAKAMHRVTGGDVWRERVVQWLTTGYQWRCKSIDPVWRPGPIVKITSNRTGFDVAETQAHENKVNRNGF